ncbi:Thioredoxin [Penicillium verhagenii]|uniref:Thioredoxin n=1 Tax=Penicillium verhagenii TaxID=1562060 RepID=UPI002544D682|nr:Thioredoxin [Penicillium verhagenii]KAJ5928577.1 Thioredoxin [Penicillium verhagenii]
MSVINISSNEQFSSLLTSSRVVVADFYADWCGPCKAIAPVYDSLARQLSRPNQITFTKINGDQQKDLAQAYSVRSYPTFIVFENGRKTQTVAGADPRRLNEVIQKLATEATKSDGAASGDAESSGTGWVGTTVAKGYADVTDQVEVKGLELLNRDSERGEARVLFAGNKPSGIAGKGKAKAEGKADWVESDTDEQLMLYVPFQSTLKVHSLHVTSFAVADEDDDEAPMRPKTIKLYVNRSHVLGFDEADDIPAVQTVEIKEEDWDAKTGTARIDLRFVKFQNVTSLVLFFVDGDGDSEKLRVDRVRIIGDSGEKRSMGKLEKIGDEPGE